MARTNQPEAPVKKQIVFADQVPAATVGTPAPSAKDVWDLTDDELTEEYFRLSDEAKAIENRLAFVKERLIGSIEDGTCHRLGDRIIRLVSFDRTYFQPALAVKLGIITQEQVDSCSKTTKVNQLREGNASVKEEEVAPGPVSPA